MEKKFNFIEIPAKPVENDGNKLYIIVYSWIIAESKASVKTIMKELEDHCISSDDLAILSVSEPNFLSREEAIRDAEQVVKEHIQNFRIWGFDEDYTYLVLQQEEVEVPSLSNIFTYLFAHEAFDIKLRLSYTFDSSKTHLIVWQHLDANIDKIFWWMNAVKKRILLAVSTDLDKGHWLNITDAYDRFDINKMRELYMGIKYTDSIFCGILNEYLKGPEYIGCLIGKEREHLHTCGKWLFFTEKSPIESGSLSEEVAEKLRIC